jgi:hypothetical protein
MRGEDNPGEDRQKQSPHRLPVRPIEWVQVGINGGLAVIAIGALCIYHAQLNEMAAGRKNTEAQLRADVVSIDPVMWPMDAQNKQVTKDSPNIAGWSVSPGWKNVGSTPAINFKSGYAFSETPRDWSKDIHEIYKTCPARPKISSTATRLSPNDPRVELGKNLPIDVAERAQNGKSAIFYEINATYADIFQKPGDPLHHYYVCVLIEVHDAKKSDFSFLQVSRESD